MLDLRHVSVGQTSLYWHSAPDTPKTSPENARRQPTPTDTNRRQQTPTDIFKQQLAVSWGVWGCLFVSVCFSWRLLFSGVVLEISGGCMGVVWWYLSGIFGNRGRSNVFGGYLGYQSLQYGAITLFWQSPEKPNFFHLTPLRYQNFKMCICKLEKNYWGYAISVFLVPVRNE